MKFIAVLVVSLTVLLCASCLGDDTTNGVIRARNGKLSTAPYATAPLVKSYGSNRVCLFADRGGDLNYSLTVENRNTQILYVYLPTDSTGAYFDLTLIGDDAGNILWLKEE